MLLVGLALGGIDFSSYYLPQMNRLIASRSHTPTHPTERHTPSCPPPSAHPFLSLPTERSPGWLRPGRESGGGESGQPRRAGVGREGKRMRFPTRRTHV
jgi:hypothetical protein